MRNSVVVLRPAQAQPTACAYPASVDSPRGELIRRLGGTDVAVLVRGRPGSGRRWLARTLHAAAATRGPLVELDLDVGGRSAGAGTEVERVRAAVRSAAGGDLLVADVAALSAAGQSVLAETIERSGARVRVLGCVNSVPGRKLQSGLGRRLVDSFLHLELAPLHERWPELPEIVRLFVRCRAEISGVVSPPVADDLIEQLAATGWPRTLVDIERFTTRVLAGGSVRNAVRGAMQQLERAPSEPAGPASWQPLRSVGARARGDIVHFRLGKSFSHPGGSGLPNHDDELKRRPHELRGDSGNDSQVVD